MTFTPRWLAQSGVSVPANRQQQLRYFALSLSCHCRSVRASPVALSYKQSIMSQLTATPSIPLSYRYTHFSNFTTSKWLPLIWSTSLDPAVCQQRSASNQRQPPPQSARQTKPPHPTAPTTQRSIIRWRPTRADHESQQRPPRRRSPPGVLQKLRLHLHTLV